MTVLLRRLCPWFWWHRHRGHGEEAQRLMRCLVERDEEVTALGRELREAQRKNHFSEMVRAAIAIGGTSEQRPG